MRINRHEGSKKFKCPYCEKDFTTSIFVFKDHIEKDHPKKRIKMTKDGVFIKDEGQMHKGHHLEHDRLK